MVAFAYIPKDREAENKIKVPVPRKPRIKELNEALVRSGGGRMKSPIDFNRLRDKRELRKILEDTE